MAISTAVDASAKARALGIKTTFKDLRGGTIVNLPQQIAVVAQGATLAAYATTPLVVTSRKQAGDVYGYGSPIERIVAQLFPANGDGVGILPVTVYPLEDDGAGVVADGSFDAVGTATEAGTVVVSVGGVSANVAIPDTTAADAALGLVKTAIDAVLEMSVITGVVAAGELPVTAKWDGASGNEISLVVTGTVAGLTFSITAMASGATNPDVDDATAQFGDNWESIVVSGMDYADTVTLGKFAVFGEGRWGALVKKPLVVLTGFTELLVATGSAITNARKTDRVNAYAVAPGSVELPWAIAAREAARIAVLGSNNPPHDYAHQSLAPLVPGADAVQWDYINRNLAVDSGLSTSEVVNGVLVMSDTVTMYHPDGEEPPAYAYVVDVVKLQNIMFNLDLVFGAVEWKGAPLISDDTPTSNPAAKKPKDAKAVVARMIDALAMAAIISDPETAKASIQADISATNPKRLDVAFTVQLSGNTNIISVDLNFGFFFGAA